MQHLAEQKQILPVHWVDSRSRRPRSESTATFSYPFHDGDSMHSVYSSKSALGRILPTYIHEDTKFGDTKPADLEIRLNTITNLGPIIADRESPKQELDSLEKALLWFDLYRKLFALCALLNVLALIAATRNKFGYAKHNIYSFALENLVVSVLTRNEFALRLLYWFVVRTIWWTPVRIRNGVTSLLINLGGVHSGCATAGLTWSIYAAYESFRSGGYPHVVLAFAILTPIALALSIAVALPRIRHSRHDIFERFHRFVGWLGLLYLWVLVILLKSWSIETRAYHPGRIQWARSEEIWFSVILTSMIIAPWLTLRKIPVRVSVPSPKTVFLSFPGGCYTGLLGRLSRSLWLEWHPFGIISEGPMAFEHHMLIVAQGDWTRNLIKNPPSYFWTRSLSFAGLPYLAEMYERGVIVATGAGIGVTLSVCLQTKGYFHLIWIGSAIEETYGPEIMSLIRRAVQPDRITLVDTKKTGRPNTVQLIDTLYRQCQAQVVFITSNPKGTELMVNGCRARGMTAFGPLFDS